MCKSTGRTFSLLPCQLIPYHQYTVDAIIGTLISVYHFQTRGQQGYHGACLDLHPDCLVTPYLIYTWAKHIMDDFLRGYPVLKDAYPLSATDLSTRIKLIQKICLYIGCLSGETGLRRRNVLAAIKYYAGRTGNFLFGMSSGKRIRSP